jgi:hypothetical protein
MPPVSVHHLDGVSGDEQQKPGSELFHLIFPALIAFYGQRVKRHKAELYRVRKTIAMVSNCASWTISKDDADN